MNKTDELLEKLRTSIEAGRERFNKHRGLDPQYVDGVVIPNLQDVLKDVCRAIEQNHMISKPESTNGNFVVHYTSIATIVSLLQACAKQQKRTDLPHGNPRGFRNGRGQFFRLYDSAHLNDPDEGNYLMRNLNLPDEHDWLNRKDVIHAYIASFITPESSESNANGASDNLVFWRTYGREGEGCSLRLSIATSKLRRVLYGAESVTKTRELLLPILDHLRPLMDIKDDLITQQIRKTLWDSLGRIRFLYKSQAYAYERECRIVATRNEVDDGDICFDYRDDGKPNKGLRHYWEDQALEMASIFPSGSSITIGPCVGHKDDLRRSLEVLKRRADLLGPEVKLSRIRYRKS